MIPDHIVFGINQNKEGIFFKDIRQVEDEQERIQLLKLRHQQVYQQLALSVQMRS